MSPKKAPLFDDVIYHGTARSSEKAKRATIALLRLYHLTFNQSPGGGIFHRGEWSCPVSVQDDVDDYITLRNAILERPPPPLVSP